MTPRASVPKITIVTLLALSTLVLKAVAQPATCGSEILTTDINGAVLHYRECGEGEPLVFVHGSLGDLRIEALAEGFRVIAYSRRFHPPNHPPQPGDVYALQLHADDLAAFVRELEAGPAHLVAHSYGGNVALALALEHPELVRSLVLGEPPVFSLLTRTSVGSAVAESFSRHADDPSRKAFESGDSEGGVGRFLDGIMWSRLLRPASARGTDGLSREQSSRVPVGDDDR